MEIRKNIYKVRGEGNVYIYLGQEPFIIDTGSFLERENIESRIKEIIPLEEIKAILLTHMHFDHCGNSNLFPNARIYASSKEIEDYKKRPELFFFGQEPPEVKHSLKKLEPLPKEIFGLNVIEVPGHTNGSVIFIDEENKLLFSGDTVFHNGIGRTDFENSRPEIMQESVTKVYELLRTKKLELLPGHDY